MKKFLVIAVLAGFAASAMADNVSLTTARQVGATFFTAATGAKAAVPADKLELAQQLDNPTLCIPALYCFNVEGDGFVVVSGSDNVEPILAYSPDGRIDADHINPSAQMFLDEYAQFITYCQNNAGSKATASADAQAVQREWQSLLDGSYTCDITKGGSLIQTKWGQGDTDNPTYNICCPMVNGKHCITGCGPIAMAMVVHYWKYPVKGSGTAALSWNNQTVSYNFRADSNRFAYDSMPKSLKSSSQYYQKNAIGKLAFACGVVMKASWGLDGTSVTRQYLENGMEKYFLYDDELQYLERSNYNDTRWIALLHENIDSNLRPVYYAAYAPGSTGRDAGHAFVLCGSSSTSENKFYVNWGWDGGSNGYFTFSPASSIESASGYRFTNNHGMVNAMHPIESPEGIEQAVGFEETPVYPNPASEYVIIPAYDLANNAPLAVYSLDGRLIDRAIVPAHSHEYRLDLQGYAAGTYFYRLNGHAVRFVVK